MAEDEALTGGGYRPMEAKQQTSQENKGGHRPKESTSKVQEGGHKPATTQSGSSTSAPPARGPRSTGKAPKK